MITFIPFLICAVTHKDTLMKMNKGHTPKDTGIKVVEKMNGDIERDCLKRNSTLKDTRRKTIDEK